MRLSDLVRYGLWLGVAATAEANREEYHMSTTWLPHLLTNSLSLLLPDLYRSARLSGNHKAPIIPEALDEPLHTLICDNPQYTAYVTPLALGYILSHPRFNIYKGRMAELRFAGLGLDAIPHASTAFALTALVCDTVDRLADSVPDADSLAPALQWSDQHKPLVSAAVLTLATLIWEGGEYSMHRHELKLRGDVRLINMQWSVRDTLNDIVANLIGWVFGVLWRGGSEQRWHTGTDAAKSCDTPAHIRAE